MSPEGSWLSHRPLSFSAAYVLKIFPQPSFAIAVEQHAAAARIVSSVYDSMLRQWCLAGFTRPLACAALHATCALALQVGPL
mmetsp:Transcript_19805/g.68821  ORF Transcript_19805/g.68821 Transcript_19805/m.68821 type:complete len:82 (+) Transcript_19805:480-725(+)